MPIWRLQTSWQVDTAAPRDRVQINPHVNETAGFSDPQMLCDDFADGLLGIAPFLGELIVSAYDAQGSKPVYPAATAVRGAGTVATTDKPRELATCLSFYAGRNVPRRRGRVYVPTFFTGISTAAVRPPPTIARLGELATLLQGLGGVDVDWSVFSQLDNKAYAVTDWWYDDEWDAVRSRGLKSTTRVTGTTSEEGLFTTSTVPLA